MAHLGDVPGTPPLQDPILLFSAKSARVGGPHPPYGKSWIRHCFVPQYPNEYLNFYCSVAGFTAAGIAKGSLAAWMMSMAAPVEAGGVIAILQSAGAAGIGLGGNIALGGCSSATASGFYYKFGNRKENKSEMDPQEKKKTLK